MADILEVQETGALVDRDYPPLPVWPQHAASLEAQVRYTKLHLRLGQSIYQISVPEDDVPEWYEPAFNEITRINNLPPNWDSYGARVVAEETLAFALNVLIQLRNRYPTLPLPQIGATVLGGIEMEWHEGDVDLELRIVAPREMTAFFEDENAGDEWGGPIDTELTAIHERLMRFCR